MICYDRFTGLAKMIMSVEDGDMDLSKSTWITADSHFGDADAISTFKRPYTSCQVSNMDSDMIHKLNAVVGTDDHLIHLGDFVGAIGSRKEKAGYAESIRQQIKCKRITLIRGNHDPVQSHQFDQLFDQVHDILSVKFKHGNDIRIVMCHYPLRSWQGMKNGSLHLYGHVHGGIVESGRSTDVGVDCWNFQPLKLIDVVHMLMNRPPPDNQGWQQHQAPGSLEG